MYFQAEFWYDGPKGDETDHECSRALIEADEHLAVLRERLKPFGVRMLNAYMWPDGSLYKYLYVENPVSSDKETVRKALSVLINLLLEQLGVREKLNVTKFYDEDADRDPYKNGCKTVKEYFEKHKEEG